ncbi:MAG: 50S ribosomal protein L29 [Chitinophagaceae bacterium]|nr:50S ribosomal protein L29 [Chitinophagaceae bacterium]
MAKKQVNKNEGLSEISLESLKGRISEDQLRLKKLHFAHAMTPLENPMMIRSLRKDIARLQTELSKRK